VSQRIRAYLVDDEPLALRRLAHLLEETKRVEIIGSTSDPEEARKYLSGHPVDVLFLDIEMPGMTGFDLVQALAEQPRIIFTTAYNQHALKAFEVNSIDYLLKPVAREHLERALAKLDRLQRPAPPPSDQLRAVIAELRAHLGTGSASYPDRIPSRVGGHVHLIELSQVTHFFARDKLSYAAVPGKSYVVDATIADLEQKLDPRHFLRIHRSTLVNLDFVEEMHGWFAGGVQVRLKDADRTELTVARDRVRALKDRLGL
jgi:two-component system LytT family response regulator